jgi:hypothetical protein
VVRSTARAILTTIAIAACVAALAGLLVRHLPVDNHAVLIVATSAPHLLVGAPVAALALLLSRRLLAAAAALVLTTAGIAVELPLCLAEAPPVDAVPVRAMSANLYLGQADPRQVVTLAEARADVLAVQELTPGAVAKLSAAALDRLFPDREPDARPYASGVGVWSRFPLTASGRTGFELAMVRARIRIDGASSDPTVLVAHVSGPWPQPIDDLARDMRLLPDTLDRAASEPEGDVSWWQVISTRRTTCNRSAACCGTATAMPPSKADQGSPRRIPPTPRHHRSSPSTTY